MMNYDELYMIELTYMDNEPGDEGEGDPNPDPSPKVGDPNPGTGKTFTQDEVNDFVQKRQKALKDEYAKLEANYQTLLKEKTLTVEQRKNLENSLEELRVSQLDEKQRAEKEKKRQEEKYASEIKSAREDADRYKNMFEQSTIKRAISDAAAKHEAFSPTQMVNLLKDQTVMVMETDSEGNETGELVPKVKWRIIDPDTKQPAFVMKSPDEAVEAMKEDYDEYGNLFRPNVTSGIGQGTAPGERVIGGGLGSISKLTTAEYMEKAKDPAWRKRMGLS